MERFYQIISRHFSQSEIAVLAGDLGIYVPSNVDPNSMARELFSGARRNLRLDVLFNEVYSRKAALELDLGPNLYELIAGTFNEREVVQLARNLGLDRLNVGLDADGLIGWNNDDFFKSRKAQTLQETALKQGKYEALLAEMKNIRPSLDLTVFQRSILRQLDKQAAGDPSQPGGQSPIDPTTMQPQIIQYIQNIYGDHVLGDKFEGDKVKGNVIKDVNISGVSGGAFSLTGDAVAGTQIKDVQGNVTLGGDDASSRDALLALINLLNQDLIAIKADLRERDAEEAAEFMQQVENEVQAKKPDGSYITRKLKSIAEIATAAGATAAAANQLGPHVQQAIQIVQSLFGG
jgi:hypothetical protein